MIERFQELKNIGTFKETKQIARCNFNHITVVFGGNSHGKSTMCDIIKSLSLRDSSYIEERKTVGVTGSPKVKISFGNSKEATYTQSGWTFSADILEASNISIFDSEFVQKNVFTNSSIERKNKENFTDFILGSEGAEIQEQLIELKVKKQQDDSEAEKIKSQIEREIAIPFDDFLNIEYKDNIDAEDTQCLGFHQQIIDLQRDKKDITGIKALPIPTELRYDDVLLGRYNKINSIIGSSYSFSGEDILRKFQEHKSHLAKCKIDFDKWVSEGLQIQQDSICPYCGQAINENKLVESYITIFCQEFISYSQDIDSLNKIGLSDTAFYPLSKVLSDNTTKIDKLKSKIHSAGFDLLLQKINAETEFIEDDVKDLECEVKQLNSTFAERINEKLQDKYSAGVLIDIEKFTNLVDKLFEDIKTYNEILILFNSNAKSYLDSLSVDAIEAKIKEFQTAYNGLDAIVKRNKYNDLVTRYNSLNQSIKQNIIKTKTVKQEFDDTQSRFLEEFFDDINKYYQRLGSQNYTIERSTNSQGTKKVYTVKLFFRGKEISNDKIQFVLSDSDKRALALSIFLAKLKHISNLENSIIVMDDPITSFDDNRINLFISIIKEFQDANQIVILTHYEAFYKKLADLTYCMTPVPAFIKIQYGTDSNQLISVIRETDELLMSEYERSLYKMWSFIEGISHDYSSNDARTLMHKYIEYKFYYEIKRRNISTLKFDQLLQTLHNCTLLNDSLYKKLDAKREEFNVSSHTFDIDLEDAKRNSISDLQRLLSEV